MAIVFLAPMLAGCMDLLGSNSPPSATMSVEPTGTVKAGSSAPGPYGGARRSVGGSGSARSGVGEAFCDWTSRSG